MNPENFGGLGGFGGAGNSHSPLGSIDLDFSPRAVAEDLGQLARDNSGYLMGAGLFGLRVVSQEYLALPHTDQSADKVNYHLLFNALLYFALPAIIGAGNARRVSAEFGNRIISIGQNMESLKEAYAQTGLTEAKKRSDIEARLRQLEIIKKRTEEASGGGTIIREFVEGFWATLVSIFAISNLNRIVKEYQATDDSASQMALAIEGATGALVSLYFVKLAWNTQRQGGTISDKEKQATKLLKQTGN